MPIDAALQRLIDLDRIDREITRLNSEIAALPKRITLIESQLATSKAKLEASQARVKAIDSDKRKNELDIQSTQEKIAKLRSQSSSVKTNEQYKALLHEIAFAEKEIAEMEDKILEGMESAETLAPQIKQAKGEFDAEAKRVEEEKRAAHDITELDKKELQRFQGERTELRSGVAENWLMHYDRVVKGRQFGVALARDSRCTACQVSIRPQTWNQVLNGNEIVACDSCSRILWTKDEVVKPEESSKKKKHAEQPVAD
jgi:predicted  nucleic acid-binding Zn-ribbon protein